MAASTKAKKASNRSNGGAPSTESKLKTPAIAAGTAAVGLVGGLALAGRGSKKKVLGVPVPSRSAAATTSKHLADAAKQLGSFGERAGVLATKIRLVREGVANTPGRSPIEVVLQGLTSRGTK